ncbi:MAG: RDD family protein [Candidatus Nanopelagicales bacterium]
MSMQPGWYPDPFSSGSGYVRWWDGQKWGQSQAAPAAAPAPEGGAAPSAPAPMPPPPPPAPAPPAWGAPAAPGAPAYGAPAYGQPEVAPFPLATWGQRALAKIIDIVLETLLTLPFAFWLLAPAISTYLDTFPTDGSLPSQESMAAFQTEILGSTLSLSLISTAITFLYEVPQNVRWGRTIGMRVLGIRIRPLAVDVPLTWVQATIRWATYAVGVLVAGVLWSLVDYLWPLWDRPWRQALHDKTAKTVVVPHR